MTKRKQKNPKRKRVNSMEAYVTPEYYRNTYSGGRIPDEELTTALNQASRHIDSLTYNRIVGRGFSNLTAYQQDLIREVICQQAEYEYEYRDEINSVLSSYSINGVSVQFAGNTWNVFSDKGVAMRRDVYAMLCQTGLCCQVLS